MSFQDESAMDKPPTKPSVWFMYDNHTFRRIEGSPIEMGFKVMESMVEDHFCGYVTVRAFPDGPLLNNLTFHGDYKNPANTRVRVAKWIGEMAEMFPDLA